MATAKKSSSSSSAKKKSTSSSKSKSSTSKKKSTVKDDGIVGVLGEELLGAAIGKAKETFLDEVEEKTADIKEAIISGKGLDGVKEIFVHEEVKTTTSKKSESSSDELRELKKLLDDGVITQKDFDAKKKKILGV